MVIRAGILFATIATSVLLRAEVSCFTWNMKWFPSGLSNLRAEPAEENRNTIIAGTQISYVMHALDEGRCLSRSVLFLQEIRDAVSCSNLIDAISVDGLKVAAVSDFKDEYNIPLWQQTAILTTLPIVDAGCEVWKGDYGKARPPRGYAYAILDGGEDGIVVCFCIHLKSNLNWSGDELETQSNIYKRERSANGILRQVDEIQKKYNRNDLKVVVAGDFNTNEDDSTFVSESTLKSFYGAHYRSCFSGLKKNDRVTCPASGRFPDATFDYILYKGFGGFVSRRIFDGSMVSDHNIVAISLRSLPKE